MSTIGYLIGGYAAWWFASRMMVAAMIGIIEDRDVSLGGADDDGDTPLLFPVVGDLIAVFVLMFVLIVGVAAVAYAPLALTNLLARLVVHRIPAAIREHRAAKEADRQRTIDQVAALADHDPAVRAEFDALSQRIASASANQDRF